MQNPKQLWMNSVQKYATWLMLLVATLAVLSIIVCGLWNCFVPEIGGPLLDFKGAFGLTGLMLLVLLLTVALFKEQKDSK